MKPRIAIPVPHSQSAEYAAKTLPQYERAVESAGGKIVLVPFVPGKSTTSLLEKIARL